MDIQAALQLSRDVFGKLDRHWQGDEQGMARPGYSREENEAIEILTVEAKTLGMESYLDLAGNVYFIYPGANRDKPVFMTGSHLDAVPNGGRYDGPAGVVAGFAAVKAIHESNITPDQDICVVAWRNEESPWFGQFAVGSKLACGDLSKEFLKATRKDTGRSLASHMSDIGLDGNALAAALDSGQTLLPMDEIGAYVELHIEQGSQLEKAEKSLGVVTGIRGNLRFPKRISFTGAPGHSGAVPQAERLDAVLAGADFLGRFAAACKKIEESGDDIVWCCPVATTGENASPTTIPAHFEVQPEVRSLSNFALCYAEIDIRKAAVEVELETGVHVDVRAEHIVKNKPVPVEEDVQDFLENVAGRNGISSMRLPSGAGHDAGILAGKGVSAGMLFLRHGNEGASHRPDEIMTLNAADDPFDLSGDFANAVRVLAASALNMKALHKGNSGSQTSFGQQLKMRGAKPL